MDRQMVKSIKMSVEQYETVGLHNVTVSAQVVEPRLVFVSHYHLLPTNQISHNSPRLSRLVRTQSLPTTNQSAVFVCGPVRDYVLLFTLWQKESQADVLVSTRSADRDRDAACSCFTMLA